MRFSPRRRTEDPVAAYAGILDGRHLWLTLESGGPAELESQGRTFPLEQVTDLLELLPDGADDPGDDPAFYDVLAGGREVWSRPFPDDPIRVPVSPDGLTQLELGRTETGHLRVGRRPLAPTVVLDAIELRGADVHLTLRPRDGVRPGIHLLLLDTDDEPLVQLPVTAHEGHVEALVGVTDLPAGYFGTVRLALGTEDAWVRIRRRHNDLKDLPRGVLMPELRDPDSSADDDTAARFRWNPDALLVLRVLDPAEQSGTTATVTQLAGHA